MPKLCPFRKRTDYVVKQGFSNYHIETFLVCVEDNCMSWNEEWRVCNMCSDKRVYNCEVHSQ